MFQVILSLERGQGDIYISFPTKTKKQGHVTRTFSFQFFLKMDAAIIALVPICVFALIVILVFVVKALISWRKARVARSGMIESMFEDQGNSTPETESQHV